MVISAQELEGFRRDRYFARSGALVTKDKDWWKTAILLVLACLVPIVGALGAVGYVFEWMRNIAWGNNVGIRESKTDIGQAISSGWRVFAIGFIYFLVYVIVLFVVSSIPVLNGTLLPLWLIVGFLLMYFVVIAQLRATIYQKFSAGFEIKTIIQMMKHDPYGLGRIFCLSMIVGYVSSIIASIFMGGVIVSLLNALVGEGFIPGKTMTTSVALRAFYNSLTMTIPSFIVNLVIVGMASMALSLLVSASFGLWMRQFNLPAWGQSKEPLPPFIYDPRDEVTAASAAETQSAPADPVRPVQPQPAQSIPVQNTAPVAIPTPMTSEPAPQAAPVVPVTPATSEAPEAPAGISVEKAASDDTDVTITPIVQPDQAPQQPAGDVNNNGSATGEQGIGQDPFAPAQ